jgi:hypothetical protein
MVWQWPDQRASLVVKMGFFVHFCGQFFLRGFF